MNPFKRLFSGNTKIKNDNNSKSVSNENFTNSFQNSLSADDDFSIFNIASFKDTYLCNAWVNIAVNILIRNIARADFVLEREGVEQTTGSLHDLFHRPNDFLSRYDLWKETAAWWFLEGEAFWWFGSDYSGGLPKEIYILNPRKLHAEIAGLGGVYDDTMTRPRRWFYQCGGDHIPILSDEIIHFKDWNPWNPLRGVNPLVSLALEIEQDYFANRANSTLLKNNAIPQGLLKTDQTLRPEEAD
jgi:HK97 family phage portal protein